MVYPYAFSASVLWVSSDFDVRSFGTGDVDTKRGGRAEHVVLEVLQSLCLNVEMLSAGEEVELKDLEDDVFRTAASLGIDISRPERPDVEV